MTSRIGLGASPRLCGLWSGDEIKAKMAIGRTVYNALFRRTSTFILTMVVGAVFFERAFDVGADRLWERMNQGVSVRPTILFVAHQ